MLSETEFGLWSRRVGLSETAALMVQQIRAAGPARRVRSGSGNVSGRYPSRKMGCTIQFESHRNELAVILELEHDQEVLEYYDQPTTIKLRYQSRGGRALGVMHTPDFFVLRPGEAHWAECTLKNDLLTS